MKKNRFADSNGVAIYEEVARYNSVYKEVEIKRFSVIMDRNPNANPLDLYQRYIMQAEKIVDFVKCVIVNDLYDGLEYNTARYLNKAALCFREAEKAVAYQARKANKKLFGGEDK